jgi:hypothetical protein
MGGPRTLSTLLACLGCGLLLAACGGGGNDESTAGSTAGESGSQASTGEAGGAGNQGSGGAGGSEKGTGAGKGSAQGGENGSGSGENGSGSGSVERSTAFKTKGGDNSIQEYGEEGPASDRSRANQAIQALYDAYRTGNWGEICNKYLSESNLKEIKLLSEKSPQIKGSTCADVLGGLNQTNQKAPDTPASSVAAVRIEGDTAFALYRGIDGKGYAIPLKLEGGTWKLTALAPTPLEF